MKCSNFVITVKKFGDYEVQYIMFVFKYNRTSTKLSIDLFVKAITLVGVIITIAIMCCNNNIS